MGKTALVISGGGSKGAFAVGVVQELAAHFPDTQFDQFVGTSTGSLICPLAALGELDLLQQLYTTVTTDNIISKGNIVTRLLGDDSLFDALPLGNLIKQYYTDDRCNRLLQLNQQIFLATTCLQTGQAVYFTNSALAVDTDFEVHRLNNPDEVRHAILASACQPVLMPPIEVIKGSNPLRQYVDGGVRQYAGIQLAIDAGADKIFAILLTPSQFPPEETTYDSAFNVLLKTLDIFISEVGENDVRQPAALNRALRYIEAVKQKMTRAGVSPDIINQYFNQPLYPEFSGRSPLKIYLIRPDQLLGGGEGGLDFNPDEMKNMLALGSRKISEFMAGLPPDGSGNV